VSYGLTFSNNLFADNFRAARGAPRPHLAFDLNRNLRVRNRSNQYDDARELARGAIASLRLVQLSDDQVLERLAQMYAKDPAPEWRLTIDLEGAHDFNVRPRGADSSLFLEVV
jgi:hypothetical protein